MNVLVIGANGQLGTCLRDIVSAAGTSAADRYVFSDVNSIPGVDTVPLDATNLDALRLLCNAEQIDVIVNCAAYTNVDKAEDDIQMAELINSTAPANMATICRENGAALIHISTDYVFNGRAFTPWKEDDTPEPVSVYGATKLKGEKAILKSGCRNIIIRTAWLYSPYGKNFCKTMLGLTETKPSLKVVVDQVGSPTYAGDLAALIFKIITERMLSKQGIYHYSNEGAVSWFDFTQAIARISGHKDCRISPCRSSEYPSKVQRPPYSVLDKSKVKTEFGVDVPYWYDSLEKCIEILSGK